MAYGDFKDLTRMITSDKILRDKVFNTAKNPKSDWYQMSVSLMVERFLDKTTSGRDLKKEKMSDQQFSEELHKQSIKKFKKRKVQLTFIDNIWGANLVDIQLISKFNKGSRVSLGVIDIFSKYTWAIPLKDKKGITITNAFKMF